MYKVAKVTDINLTNVLSLVDLVVTNTEKNATIVKKRFIEPRDIFQMIVGNHILDCGNMLIAHHWGDSPKDNVIYTQRHVVVREDTASYAVLRLTPQGHKSLIRVDKLPSGEYIAYLFTLSNTAHHRREMKRFGIDKDNFTYEVGGQYKPLPQALQKTLDKKANPKMETIDLRDMYIKRNYSHQGPMMKTVIQLKSIATTKIEELLNDTVTHHASIPSLIRGEMVPVKLIEESVKSEELHDVKGAILTIPWKKLTDEAIIQTQYVALEDLGEDDIELILRVDPFGNRTIISIETYKDEDDYDNAVTHIYYEGSEIRLREELTALNVTMDDFESVVGDLLVDHRDLDENTFGSSKAFVITDVVTGKRVVVDKQD